MLSARDATWKTDLEIAGLVGRWTGQPAFLPVPPYTGNWEETNRLRKLMEVSGRTGDLRAVTIDEVPTLIYVCRNGSGPPFAQGVGTTPGLAICDAFLRCCDRLFGSTGSSSRDAPPKGESDAGMVNGLVNPGWRKRR